MITCTMTSNATPCLTGSPATSNPITMTVKPRPIATATNSSSNNMFRNCNNSHGFIKHYCFNYFYLDQGQYSNCNWNCNYRNGNISGTLTNTTAIAQTVTFTITPSANGCSGTAIMQQLSLIQHQMSVATNTTPNICSGIPLNITFSGSVSGTTYTWTRDNTTLVTGIPSGTGNISGTLANTTGVNQTVNFTITPTANGCPGATTTATVTVQPAPVITVQPVAPAAICNGGGNATISVTATGGTTYQWRKNGVNLTNAAPYSNVTIGYINHYKPGSFRKWGSFDVVVTSATGCTVTSSAVT